MTKWLIVFYMMDSRVMIVDNPLFDTRVDCVKYLDDHNKNTIKDVESVVCSEVTILDSNSGKDTGKD